ncbi:MAG TPA: hypothetical protein VFP20_05505 [Bacteroidales bacterium]|nr:hypothetical protein [Bacteroidales bacterium]
MKKIISMLLLLMFLALTSAQAQNPNRNQLLRQRIEQAKLHQIRLNLNLDEVTFVQFRPVYLRYERTLANIDFKSQNRILKVNADSLTTLEADELLFAQWSRAKQLIQVRERFYREFRKILSAQQLIKLYQSETEIRQKVMSEFGKRKRQTI